MSTLSLVDSNHKVISYSYNDDLIVAITNVIAVSNSRLKDSDDFCWFNYLY
jgi:hypothetical protein